jgi:hypothetical protein
VDKQHDSLFLFVDPPGDGLAGWGISAWHGRRGRGQPNTVETRPVNDDSLHTLRDPDPFLESISREVKRETDSQETERETEGESTYALKLLLMSSFWI